MNIPIDEIFRSYLDCRKKKTTTSNEIEFELDITKNIVNLWEDLKYNRYQIGTSIAFIVKYPKPREIFAANFRDRIIHHFLIGHLEPYFENDFIEDNYNCRKNKGTLFGVRRLRDKIQLASDNFSRDDLFLGKFDMKSFFVSINKLKLCDMLERYIIEKYDGLYKDEILTLTRQVVMHRPQDNCILKSDRRDWELLGPGKSLFSVSPEYGLPIGNLTSQVFANFYLHTFDQIMRNVFPLGYGRYVDDFYVLARSIKEITEQIPNIRDYLKTNLDVTLHPDKQYIQHYKKGIKFIGNTIKFNRIYVGNGTLHKMWNKIHYYNKLEDINYLYEFYRTLNSYYGFFRHTDNYNYRKKIWNEVISSWWKEFLDIAPDYSMILLRSGYTIKDIKVNEAINNFLWQAGRLD